MASGKELPDFPDVQAKLQKPTKQSAFEKQKAEAEAKRQREAAETAAVYKDFIKSFDDDDDDDQHNGGYNHDQRQRFPSGPGASRRHFSAQPGRQSGPGSLGPPPPTFGQKRSFQDYSRGHRDRSHPGHDDHDAGSGSRSLLKAFNTSDDEDMGSTGDRAKEKAIARPTLRLTNLPPGSSPSVIKALMPDNLVVEIVKIQPNFSSGGSERRCVVAIVTLSQETPAYDIEAAVSLLQNKYLGYGHYLSLHRHLSSAVSTASTLPHIAPSATESHPFGAKPVDTPSDGGTFAQQGLHRTFAPPSSYNQPLGGVNRSSLLHVPVKPPNDIRTIKIINKVIEGVLKHGPEFEALIMSRPEVRREEKWAWIWDARSEGGIWYRWRIWEITTGVQKGGARGKFVPLFEGSHAWKSPEKHIPFEYTTKLEEFITDSEYNSSDDDDLDGETNRESQGTEVEKSFLNPLEKAKLTHFLARLPTTLSKLRKGDIARITTFAIMHATRGVDEVVDMIVSNVEKSFSLTKANPDRKLDVTQGTTADENISSEGADPSAAALVALYVVSDVLSSSSTSGVRHAWRFRQLFEASLRDRKVFEYLGMMAEKLGWGRMRADKWKRSVKVVLNLWEGWCVFPTDSQELFAHTFDNPPALNVESKADDSQKKGKWKVVEATKAERVETAVPFLKPSLGDVADGEPIKMGEDIEEEDVEGEPIDDDDVEGEPISDEDLEGEPIEDSDIMDDPAPQIGEVRDKEPAETQIKVEEVTRDTGLSRKPRMRAADMYSDSDASS